MKSPERTLLSSTQAMASSARDLGILKAVASFYKEGNGGTGKPGNLPKKKLSPLQVALPLQGRYLNLFGRLQGTSHLPHVDLPGVPSVATLLMVLRDPWNG